jgi:preprotein translocase subunit SecY
MKFFEYIKNIWNITELRDRISLTLGLLVVYRFGAQVVLPGIDASKLGQFAGTFDDQGILGLLNAFTGGAFANASVFALGIMPYISASIVVQLLGTVWPPLEKLQKEGESGRKKINEYTRYATVGICLLQSWAYVAFLSNTRIGEASLIQPSFLVDGSLPQPTATKTVNSHLRENSAG